MNKSRLELWQGRLEKNEAAYSDELAKMDGREAQYAGDRSIPALVEGEKTSRAVHVRNLSAELIEAQVDSSIPQPKVTARRRQDEPLAKIIEDMLRNELDRLPMETINDMMERIVPIQGGGGYLVEWDSRKRTHFTVGELAIMPLHPRQIIPQAGVYESIEAADYVILRLPQTKEGIRQRYGVDVSDEHEAAPEVRGASPTDSDDLVTQYVAYYRGRNGIGKYSWVGNTELEDLEDYQARRARRCKVCGAAENEALQPLGRPTMDGTYPGEEDAGGEDPLRGVNPQSPDGDSSLLRKGAKKVCPFCGADRWEESPVDYEEVWMPIRRSGGLEPIPGAQPALGPPDPVSGMPGITMEPTRIPAYKPDLFPVILQRNVSVYGKFLGESDLDKIVDQQHTANRIESKIIDKLLKSGSYITLPDDADIRVDAEDMKIIRPGKLQNKELIGVYDLQGNVGQDLTFKEHVYEEARQIIGITDSFQGRRDPTATSGKAKEFAAAQTSGRMESKRIMKMAAYATLFEVMFKFRLAYADEPRPIVSQDTMGDTVYSEFNRYDFLEKDSAGAWVWNDRFLFSCDSAAPLAGNREALWQETRLNFQTGAFGDQKSIDALLLFWSKMNELHYPLAADTLSQLKQLKAEQAAQQQAMMAQQKELQGMAIRQAAADAAAKRQSDAGNAMAAVEQARQDAAAARQEEIRNPQMMR